MNRVRCNVTNLWFSTDQKRMDKLLRKFGSQEKLESSYVSRVGRRLLGEGKTREEIQAMVADGQINSKAKEPVRKCGKRGRKAKVATEINTGTAPVTNDPEVQNFMTGTTGIGKAV